LAEAIEEVYENQGLLSPWGKNGRAFVSRHFASKTQVERLEKLFLSLCGNKGFKMNNPWTEVDS